MTFNVHKIIAGSLSGYKRKKNSGESQKISRSHNLLLTRYRTNIKCPRGSQYPGHSRNTSDALRERVKKIKLFKKILPAIEKTIGVPNSKRNNKNGAITSSSAECGGFSWGDVLASTPEGAVAPAVSTSLTRLSVI